MSSSPGARGLLGLASVAVAFSAADTYVVVLALPEMMSGAGLGLDELSRAAPIVSGFLLGYVAILPLIGRVADLRGRVPVLVGSLVVFALGSLVTAAAYDLPSMVTGRFLQGIGGGGLVPATLALVADLYPPQRRGLPLGLVGAVQELGSVLGPVYGAVVLAVADWRAIFWVNLVVAAGLAVAVRHRQQPTDRARVDRLGVLLGLLCLVAVTLVMLQPPALATDLTIGLGFVPLAGGSRWLSPLGITAVLLAVGFSVRCASARHPVVDVHRWRQLSRRTDVLGAALLAVCLAGIILAFASADPEVQALSPAGGWLLAGSAFAGAGFWWRTRRARSPLVPAGAFAATAARGALVVSFFVGAALIAALVDVPVFARVTVYPDSQLAAALVLLRLLVGLPVGALLGGYLIRRLAAGPVTAAGMLLAAVGFAVMATWGPQSLAQPVATVPLVGTGLGFGLALAPVNAALLATTRAAEHGVASALLVVARMVGMLVGISALTTLGLRRYYAVQADLPGPAQVCGSGTRCPEYTALLRDAGLTQLQTVFVGAAGCAAVAAALALLMFRGAPTRSVSAAEALRSIG